MPSTQVQNHFLLDPSSNEDFVAGRGPRKHPTQKSVLLRYLLAAAVGNAILLGAQIQAFWLDWPALSETNKRFSIAAIPLTILANLIGRAIYRAFRKRAQREEQLTQQGRILQGRVVSCAGVYDGAFRVRLEYEFMTPDGRRLTGKKSQERPDLERVRLPDPGAPVSVVYLDDSLYQVM